MNQIELREEQPGDIEQIYEITRLAFIDRPYAAGDEQDVVNALRDRDALLLSLVAESINDNKRTLVGQVTFSPMQQSDGSGPWVGLGPVSVTPTRQSEGIGGMLIREGLARMKADGALGCVLTGNPDYYSRFGFELAPDNVPESEPAEYFQMVTFGDQKPLGTFTFHDAFYNP